MKLPSNLALLSTLFLVTLWSGTPSRIGSSSTYGLELNGVIRTLTTTDYFCVSQDSFVTPASEEVTVSNPVTIFALDIESPYGLPTYTHYSVCKCWWDRRTACGDDCPSNPNGVCVEHKSKGFWCSKSNSYCISIWPSEVQTYNSYSIRPIEVFSSINYNPEVSRPKVPQDKLNPDTSLRTISLSLQGKSYTENAFIKDYQTRGRKINDLILLSHDQSLSTKTMLRLFDKITYETNAIDVPNWDCAEHPIWVKYSRPTVKVEPGYTIIPIVLPQIKTLDRSDLKGGQHLLLSTTGFVSYSPKHLYVDPCQRTLVRLIISDTSNQIVVKTDPSQGSPMTCLVSSDLKGYVGLVETTPEGFLLVPSKKFKGAISVDYVSSYTLSVTTQSTIPPVEVALNVSLGYSNEGDSPVLTFQSNVPADCVLYVSQNCTFHPNLTATELQTEYSLQLCIPLFERTNWVCGLSSGWFVPPVQLLPLNASVEIEFITSNSTFTPDPDNDSWEDELEDLFSDFSPANLLHSIIVVVITCFCIALVFTLVAALRRHIVRRKSREKFVLVPQSS